MIVSRRARFTEKEGTISGLRNLNGGFLFWNSNEDLEL